MSSWKLVALLGAVLACSNGGGDPPPPACVAPAAGAPRRAVELTWAPNRERGVNAQGGGYRVEISCNETIEVPWELGPEAPTSTIVTLPAGTYTVAVRAYAALDAQGGSAGAQSARSQPITVQVP